MAQQLRASMLADPELIERVSLHSCVTEADVKHYLELAFKEPVEYPLASLTTIPKITLVVGAGKLERAKYEEDLPKWVASSLRDLKFQEDRGATAILACAGTYKYQHDTGKNEKYVHVFPFAKIAEKQKDAEDDDDTEEVADEMTGIEKAKWMCVISELSTFKEMVSARIGTWLCKKRVMQLLKEKDDVLIKVEEKLTSRVALTPEEQKLFDSCDRAALEEKMAYLRGEMLKMVEEDKLTKQERQLALEQIKTKIAELEAVGQKSDAAKARAAAVEAHLGDKGFRFPLKNEEKMKQLWRKTLPLEKLVEKAGPKGRWNTSLSPAEVKALGEKEEWEQEIQSLASASRFWFEEDVELAARVAGAKALMGNVKAAAPKSASSSSQPAARTMSRPGASATNAWATVGKPGGASKTTGSASGKPGKAANSFAGLADDSDSD